MMKFRFATLDDCPLLAGFNRQLIQDEGSRNQMSEIELEQRMRHWLSDEYRAVLFEDGGEVVAYALFREKQEDEIYLRQLFVIRDRRGEGIGRCAVELLRKQVWALGKRLTVEVLSINKGAADFWHAVGYTDYSLTLEILPPAD